MSFYTSLYFYRPTEPPVVTGESLASFIHSFSDLKVSNAQAPLGVKVKFGKAIDQDEKPASWQEPLNKVISVSAEVEWDLAIECQGYPGRCQARSSLPMACVSVLP